MVDTKLYNLKFIVPQEAENLITNPSVEIDTTGWTAVNSTLSQVNTRARFGFAALQVVTDGLGGGEGAYFTVDPSLAETPFLASVYLRGAGKVRLQLIDQDNALVFSGEEVQLNDDRWTRIDKGGSTGAIVATDLRLQVVTTDSQTVTFYIDGAQIEQGSALSTYVDGDQEGCQWNIVSHSSTSTRSGEFRRGGQIVDVDLTGAYVTMATGLGMPQVTHNLQDTAFEPGVHFESTSILARTIALTMHANVVGVNLDDEPCQEGMIAVHQIRQRLIDIIKPDRAKDQQEFMVMFDLGRFPLIGFWRYSGGLEWANDLRNDTKDDATVRFLAVDPFWLEDSQEVEGFDNQQTVADTDYTAARINGEWQALPFTPTDGITAIAEAPDGTIYFGAEMVTGANNEWRLASWNGTAVALLGTALNDVIEAISVTANGDVYVGGQFTDYEPAAAGPDFIARFDVSANAWAAAAGDIGFGANKPNNIVQGIDIDEVGDVWIVGNFTAAVVANTVRIAKWDVSAGVFVSVDPAPITFNNAFVFDILVISSTDVYVTGSFTAAGGSVGDYVAYYDGTTWTEVGGGFDAQGRVVIADIDNMPIFGGNFIVAGTETVNRITKWNGSAFLTFGSGMNSNVFSLSLGQNGIIYAGGQFQTAGGINLSDTQALWNGTTWAHLDINTPGAPAITHAILLSRNNDIYIGIDQPGDSVASAVETETNIGTRKANPVFRIAGITTDGAIIKWLENQTIDSIIYLDYTFITGEELLIDFVNKTIVSNFRGKIMSAMLSNSDFGKFALLPGDNVIATFIDPTTGDPEILMKYTPTHWSFDALGDDLNAF